MKRSIRTTVAILLLASAASFHSFAQASDRDVLRDRIDMLISTQEATVAGKPIYAVELLDELYARRNYEPAWSDPGMLRQLVVRARMAAEHGLDPEDFHAQELAARLTPGPRSNEPHFKADTEILCTSAFVRLAVALQYGKLDPANLDPSWNFSRKIARLDPLAYLNQVLDSKKIAQALDGVGPKSPFYTSSQKGLKQYRSIEAAGGWPSVPDGPGLKLGSNDPRVELLRKRLRITGDLTAPDPSDPRELDGGLEAAVKRFQTRHGIDADGKVGPRTLEELNVPVEARINQFRASLERSRWVFRDLPDDHIIVDVAGFHAYLVKDGKQVWKTRVQVGKPYHATPIFKDTMRYVEINPTWTIPPGILRKETLPTVRRDPGYLGRNHMSVVTHAGEVVDPASIDWAATAGGRFPYMIRQEPGEHNALGRVKFMFPNRHMVYLHDTPSKGHFARTERAFSHGCIRTQNPFDLAELLLADKGWDRQRIEEVLASKKTTRVSLGKPLPVMILYWTAEVDRDGTVYFRKDLYNRDARIINGLDATSRVAAPEGALEAIQRP